MRVLLDEFSKRELFKLLKNKYNSNTIQELSKEINIPVKTLQAWFYLKERYIPESIIDQNFKNLKIIDKKEDNWGMKKGGFVSYNKIIDKKGIKRFRQMQSLGGKRASKTKELISLSEFNIDLNDPLFLEFYGNILGDGWLSNFNSGNKKVWLIGMCGNLSEDKELMKNYMFIIEKIFNRKRKVREKKESNVIELVFSHKHLLKYMNEKLKFPIGQKENLYIHKSVTSLGFGKIKYVIKGIFDTDGTFYLQRNRKGIPSFPVIAIHMNELKLIKQIGEVLTGEDFKVNYSDNGKMIRIHGREQLQKWMNEIGSSNPKHTNKINNFLSSKDKSA